MIWRWVATLLLALTAYVTASSMWGIPLYLTARKNMAVQEEMHRNDRIAAVDLATADASPPPAPAPVADTAPSPETAAEEAPTEIKNAGKIMMGPVSTDPVWFIGVCLGVIALWSGLYWLFQRRLRKDHRLLGIARVQAAVPLLALLTWLPLTFEGVWWNMFAYW